MFGSWVVSTPREKTIRQAWRCRQVVQFEQCQEPCLVVWGPPIMVAIPASVACERATVEEQLVPFISMRPVDIVATADVAFEFELVGCH